MQPAGRAIRPGVASTPSCISVSSMTKTVASSGTSGRVNVTGLRQTPTPSTYHVPMGPAAVAAMTVTKSAVAATPILKSPATSPNSGRAPTPVFLQRSPMVWQRPPQTVGTPTRPAIALTVSRIDAGQKPQTISTVPQMQEKSFGKAQASSLAGSVASARVPVSATTITPQHQPFIRTPMQGAERGKMPLTSISIPVTLSMSVTVSPQQGVVLGARTTTPNTNLAIRGAVCQSIRQPQAKLHTGLCSTSVKVPCAPAGGSVSVTPLQPTPSTVTITTTNSATVTSIRPQSSIPVARVCPQPLTHTTPSSFIHRQQGVTSSSSPSHHSYGYYYSPSLPDGSAPTPFFAIRPQTQAGGKPAHGAIIHPGAATPTSFSLNPSMVVVDPRGPTPQPAYMHHEQGLKVDVNADTATMLQQDQQQNKNSHSPRPSILRKRDTDGMSIGARKPIVPFPLLMSEGSPPSPNGSSGGSTTVSANSSPGVLNENSIGAEDAVPMLNTVKVESNHSSTAAVELSPRKKPRKQQLQNKELNETDSKELMAKMPVQIKEEPRDDVDNHEEDLPVAYFPKRPHMSLLTGVRPLKGRLNHFQKYSDVKVKDDKPLNVNDLASQKHVLSKVNGWKIHHLSAQLEDLVDLESQVVDCLSDFLDFVEKDSRGPTKDINRMSELIKANLQRSKILKDQVGEAKIQMMRVFEHKDQIVEIVQKYASKRSLKRRDK